MTNIFVGLFLFSLLGLMSGMIRPKIYSFALKKKAGRKNISMIFGGLIILFFILIAVTPENKKTEIKEVKEPSIQQEASMSDIVQESIIKEKDLATTTEIGLANNTQEEIEKDALTESVSQKASDTASTYLVTKVIDGDTIAIEGGEVIRYIGIDTPETVHPSKPQQCFGQEASDKNKELVSGKRIRIEKDVSETDKYDRILRYVWVGDIFVNDYLVRQGYAYAYTYPPDVKYADQFVQAQNEAKENNRGLWAACPASIEEEPVEAPPEEFIPPADTEGAICSYNAYNCPDFSTHAEAQALYELCGGVNNDIHKLDADKDGIACEGLP